MNIYCCECDADITARLTDGAEIYPHRKDLKALPFWKCDDCGNYVGCHHKIKNNPPSPLGCIATPELRNARQEIHKILDPIWQSGNTTRRKLYGILTDKLGWKYHTSKIRNIDEARKVYRLVTELRG